MKKVTVGLVGSGFAAEIHARVFRKLHGLSAFVKAVASPSARAACFAAKHKIPDVYRRLDEMLQDPDIDVIDLCVPPNLNREMIEKVIRSGKHVICEKPLSGYFGRAGDAAPIGKAVPKRDMYTYVMAELESLQEQIAAAGVLFCYAENWVYAPAVQKAAAIVHAARPHVFLIKGEEWHSGSHAAHAANWNEAGGGALIRQGIHPLGAALYLKRQEAKARGVKLEMAHVAADVGLIAGDTPPAERQHLAACPADVEDWGMMALTFADGSKALIHAGDVMLGGIRNHLSIFTNQSAMTCNIIPNDHMIHYSVAGEGLADVYMLEKAETKLGWQYVSLEEDYMRGYVGELQDFMECVTQGRQPQADFKLACDTVRAIYAAYWAAEDGVRVPLG